MAGEATRGLQAPCVVVDGEEEPKVVPEFVVAAMALAANGGVFQRAVHPLH